MNSKKIFQFRDRDSAKQFLSDVEFSFEKFYTKFDDKPFPYIISNQPTNWLKVGEFICGKQNGIHTSKDKSIVLENSRIFSNQGFLYKDICLYSNGSEEATDKVTYKLMKALVRYIILENKEDQDYELDKKIEEYGFLNNLNKPVDNNTTNIRDSNFRDIKIESQASQKSKKNQPNLNQEKISEENKNALLSSKWILYCFWEHKEQLTLDSSEKKYGIKESLVTFNDDNIIIHNTESVGKTSLYTGKYSFIQKEGHIYIETDALTLNGGYLNRYLRIMLYCGQDNIQEMALGVFYNVRSHGSLHCGTTILTKIKEESSHENLLKNGCLIYNDWYEFDNQVIKSFLERRDLNLIKIPNKFSAFTLKELGEVIENLKSTQRKDVRLFEYDCFFSVPLTYQGENELLYSFNRKMVLSIEKQLTERFNLKNNYLACRDFETLADFDNVSDYGKIQTTFESIAKSKYFVLFYPKAQYPNNGANPHVKLSSSIIEIGFALGLSKRVIIFCDRNEKKYLPNNISNNEEVKIITFNHDEDIENITNILFNAKFNKIALKAAFSS